MVASFGAVRVHFVRQRGQCNFPAPSRTSIKVGEADEPNIKRFFLSNCVVLLLLGQFCVILNRRILLNEGELMLRQRHLWATAETSSEKCWKTDSVLSQLS